MNNPHMYQTFKRYFPNFLRNRSQFLLSNCIVSCALLALLVGGCAVSRAASSQTTVQLSRAASSQTTAHTKGDVSGQATTSGNSVSQSFAVQGTPTLVINNDAGAIHITSGSNGSVAATATKYSSDGNTSDMTVTFSQSGNTIYMTGRLPQQQSSGVEKHIDFDITAPATTNVQANTRAGLVQMQGISGQMAVEADAAAIEMQQGTLQGHSTFQTTAGAITFQGALDPSSSDNFGSTAGSIDLTLPSNASFELNATTTLGMISNEFGSDVVGSPPYAQVAIKTVVGQIAIHKGA
jgi:hypothetical protein